MSASGDKKTKSMPTAMACYEQRSCMLDLKALLSRNKLTDRNEVVSNYLDRSPLPRSSDSTTTTQSKSTSDSAMLAQRLASESSWADTYVPASPSGTGMTPSAPSIAEMSEAQLDEEPPTYESVASEAGRNVCTLFKLTIPISRSPTIMGYTVSRLTCLSLATKLVFSTASYPPTARRHSTRPIGSSPTSCIRPRRTLLPT